jgi:hypothetical protein
MLPMVLAGCENMHQMTETLQEINKSLLPISVLGAGKK